MKYDKCTYPDCFSCGYADCVAPYTIDQIKGGGDVEIKCDDCVYCQELKGSRESEMPRRFCTKEFRLLERKLRTSPKWCFLKNESLSKDELDKIMCVKNQDIK